MDGDIFRERARRRTARIELKELAARTAAQGRDEIEYMSDRDRDRDGRSDRFHSTTTTPSILSPTTVAVGQSAPTP
jgi:hypothetical protein